MVSLHNISAIFDNCLKITVKNIEKMLYSCKFFTCKFIQVRVGIV